MRHATELSKGDKARSIAAVVAIHVVLAAAFLQVSGKMPEVVHEASPLAVFDVREEPPPPPVVVDLQKPEPSPEKEGAASPENIKSQASPVVAPRPEIKLPTPLPVTAAPVPMQGTQTSQGASDRPGPGTGAGGIGTGTGSGGSGTGPGGGGGEGARPRLISRSLVARDYPREMRQRWPSGGRVLVTFDVQVNGQATGCKVYESSGDWQIDAETCRLVQTRLRFRPATDDRGQPTVSKYGYMQAPANF